MHTITMVFCYKSSFSVLGFGKDSLAPLSWSEEKLSLVFSQGPRISGRYIHKNDSHTQYSPTVLRTGKFLSSFLIHLSSAGCLFTLSCLFFLKRFFFQLSRSVTLLPLFVPSSVCGRQHQLFYTIRDPSACSFRATEGLEVCHWGGSLPQELLRTVKLPFCRTWSCSG